MKRQIIGGNEEPISGRNRGYTAHKSTACVLCWMWVPRCSKTPAATR